MPLTAGQVVKRARWMWMTSLPTRARHLALREEGQQAVILRRTHITRPMERRKCQSVSGENSPRLKNCSLNRMSKLQASSRRRSVAVLALLSTHQVPLRRGNLVFLLQVTPGTRILELRNNQVCHPQSPQAGSDPNLLLHQALPAKGLQRGSGLPNRSTLIPVYSVTCPTRRLHDALSLRVSNDPSYHFNSVCCKGVLETTC